VLVLHVRGDLRLELFFTVRFSLPTAGMVSIPSPELRHTLLSFSRLA
jgi:hypothetical protein